MSTVIFKKENDILVAYQDGVKTKFYITSPMKGLHLVKNLSYSRIKPMSNKKAAQSYIKTLLRTN